MKKMLSLGVILLFFGLVLAPSINGNNDIEIFNVINTWSSSFLTNYNDF